MPNLRSVSAAAPSSGARTKPPQSTTPGIAAANGLSFTIGQDAAGCWVALESHGIAGGLFRNRADALHYADGEIRNGTGEIRFANEPVAFSVGCPAALTPRSSRAGTRS